MTVPVELDTLTYEVTFDEDPSGNLTISTGQDTTELESAESSVVCIILVSHGSDVQMDGSMISAGWQTHSSGASANGSYYNFRILYARTDDVTFPLNLPVSRTTPSGSWVKGYAFLIRNAGTPTGYHAAVISGSSLNAGIFNYAPTNLETWNGDLCPDPPYRRLSFLMLVRDNDPNTDWVDPTWASGFDNVLSYGPFVADNDAYVYFRSYVVQHNTVHTVEETAWDFDYEFNGSGYLGYYSGKLDYIGFPSDVPEPLCNDPAHVPVTITITAHGPVDVQVD